MKPLSPVRIQKAPSTVPSAHGQGSCPSDGATPPAPMDAQLVEVANGVYDIIFHCACGKRTVIRCESLGGGETG